MSLLKQKDFFQKYSISSSQWKESKLKWGNLDSIYDDYVSSVAELSEFAIFLANNFVNINAVHSIRHRVKDPEHLIEKIIRKSREDRRKKITTSNYKTHIQDLVGIRALHIFKSDWMPIDKFIRENFNLVEKPVANIRKGDSEQLLREYQDHDCEVKTHKYGYRSIHYLIESTPTKQKYYAEIQVRSVFEEGWAEIDHKLRYPYDRTNPALVNYLSILNNLCGCADEMASFITKYFADCRAMECSIEDQEQQIDELENKIKKLRITQAKKDELIRSLQDVRDSSSASSNVAVSALSHYPTGGISNLICKNCGSISTDMGPDGTCNLCKMKYLMNPTTAAVGMIGSLCSVCDRVKGNNILPAPHECQCP